MALVSAVEEAILLENLLTFSVATEQQSKSPNFRLQTGRNQNVPERLVKHEDEAY